jgi:hypothetical protein
VHVVERGGQVIVAVRPRLLSRQPAGRVGRPRMADSLWRRIRSGAAPPRVDLAPWSPAPSGRSFWPAVDVGARDPAATDDRAGRRSQSF